MPRIDDTDIEIACKTIDNQEIKISFLYIMSYVLFVSTLSLFYNFFNKMWKSLNDRIFEHFAK